MRGIAAARWKWALREARGGFRHFRIFIVCLAIGIGVIAAVLSLNHSLSVSLERQGRVILGGDIDASIEHQPLSPENRKALAAIGTVSRTIEMRAMTSTPEGTPVLSEVKAVDGRYPLYGDFGISPPTSLSAALAKKGDAWGGIAEPALLDRLGAEVGDRIRLGEATIEITGTITHEPDLASEGFMLGPRLLIGGAALEASGLMAPGSLMQYHYRVKLPAGADLAAIRTDLDERFRMTAVDVDDRRQGAPGVARFLDRATFFLTLAGLISLMIGGLGIATATYFYLDSRTETIATLKSLGAQQSDIAVLYSLVLLVMGTVGIGLGLGIGLAGAAASFSYLGDQLPFKAEFVLGTWPITAALCVGFLTVLGLGILPVGRAARVSPARLFRQVGLSAGGRAQYGVTIIAALATLGLLAVIVAIAPRPIFAVYFLAGTIAAGGAFWGIGLLLARVFRRLPRPHTPRLALALGNLARPGHQIPIVVLSLGLGMSLLVAIAHIRHSLETELTSALPENAPSFFLTDIRRPDMPKLKELIAAEPAVTSAVTSFESVPMIRGRVTHLNGKRPDVDSLPPEGRWVVRSDRGFTFTAEKPRNADIVEGQWWPPDYDGPPLVSLEAEAGRALGLEIGDTITVNILGRSITAELASLREVHWESMALNFAVMFSPGALEDAPYQYLATLQVPADKENAVARTLGRHFPNLTVIRVSAVVERVSSLLGQVLGVIGAAAGVTILCGLLVVAGATAAGFRQRLHETAILRAVGATSRDIQWAFLGEFLLLGLIVAGLALLIGTAGAYFVVDLWMEGDWTVGWPLALTVLGGVLVGAVAFALVTYRNAMRHSVSTVLRAP